MASKLKQTNNFIQSRATGDDFDDNETKEKTLAEIDEEKFVEELARAIIFIAKASV